MLTLAGHTGAVRSLAFSGDSQHFASCCQGIKGQPAEVKVWDITSKKQQISIEYRPDAIDPAKRSLGLLDGSANVNVALSRDGRHVAASIAEATVRMWDVDTGKLATSFDAHAEEVTSLAFTDDGQRIACGSAHGIVAIWKTATHQQQLTLPGGESEGTVVSLAFSGDGRRLVSGSANGSVKVWDATTGQPKFRLKGHPLLAKAAFGGDGRLIVSASMSDNILSDIAMWENGTLTKDVSKIPLTWEARQWDAETSQERLAFAVAAAATNQLSLSGDGERVVSWTANGTVTEWSTRAGQPQSSFKIKPANERIRALTGRILALGRDGRRLASTDLDRKVRLWDVTNGKQTFVLPDPPGRFLCDFRSRWPSPAQCQRQNSQTVGRRDRPGTPGSNIAHSHRRRDNQPERSTRGVDGYGPDRTSVGRGDGAVTAYPRALSGALAVTSVRERPGL